MSDDVLRAAANRAASANERLPYHAIDVPAVVRAEWWLERVGGPSAYDDRAVAALAGVVRASARGDAGAAFDLLETPLSEDERAWLFYESEFVLAVEHPERFEASIPERVLHALDARIVGASLAARDPAAASRWLMRLDGPWPESLAQRVHATGEARLAAFDAGVGAITVSSPPPIGPYLAAAHEDHELRLESRTDPSRAIERLTESVARHGWDVLRGASVGVPGRLGAVDWDRAAAFVRGAPSLLERAAAIEGLAWHGDGRAVGLVRELAAECEPLSMHNPADTAALVRGLLYLTRLLDDQESFDALVARWNPPFAHAASNVAAADRDRARIGAAISDRPLELAHESAQPIWSFSRTPDGSAHDRFELERRFDPRMPTWTTHRHELP
jgi:hypothetical protein